MNLKEQMNENENRSYQKSNLRSGQSARRQMFQLESSRLPKMSALRGQENDYSCQIPEISKIMEISHLMLQSRRLLSADQIPEIWQKNWPKMIILIMRFQRNFKFVLIKSHPQKLNQVQYRLINDQGADNIEKGWERGVNNTINNYSKILSSQNTATNSYYGNSQFIIKTRNQIKKITIKFNQQLRYLKEKIKRAANKLLYAIPVINSQSKLYLMWDMILFSISLICCFYMPFQMAFLPKVITFSEERMIFQHILLYMFVINVLIEINLTYFDQDCTFIKDQKKIIKNYLKKNLITDILLIASLAILDFYYRATIYTIRTVLFFLRLVYRNSNISRILDQYVYTDYGKAIRNLLVLFQKILFCCHIFACYFYMQGDRSNRQEGKSWLTYNSEKMNDSVYSQYINSFYFAVVTMSTIGYGDIAPITDNQKLFMIFMSLIASMLFGYTINSLATIFSQYDQKQLDYNQKNEELNQYFRDHNIEWGLQNRSQKYLEFMEKGGITEQHSIQCLNYLSPFLKEQILKGVYSRTVKRIQVLGENFSYSFLQSISNRFREQVGENSGDNIVSLGLQKEGEIFGMRQFLTNSMDPTISIRSKGICVIHSITLTDFMHYLMEYPGDRETFMSLRDNYIFNQDRSFVKQVCLSCNSLNHHTLECPYTDYCGQKNKIIDQTHRALNRFKRQFKRIPRKKNSALKIKSLILERIEIFQIKNLSNLLVYENEYLKQFDMDQVEGTNSDEIEIEGKQIGESGENFEENKESSSYQQTINSLDTQIDPSVKQIQQEINLPFNDEFSQRKRSLTQSVVIKQPCYTDIGGLGASGSQEFGSANINRSIQCKQTFSIYESNQQKQKIEFQDFVLPTDEIQYLYPQTPTSETSSSLQDSVNLGQQTPNHAHWKHTFSQLQSNLREQLTFQKIKNFVNYKPDGNFKKIQAKLIKNSKFSIFNSPNIFANSQLQSSGLNQAGIKFGHQMREQKLLDVNKNQNSLELSFSNDNNFSGVKKNVHD